MGVFNKNINFSSQLEYRISNHKIKKQQYSSLHFILLKMTISSPLKWEFSTTAVTSCNQSFSRFGTHFGDRPKVLAYSQIPPNIFLPTDCPTKIKVSQAQTNWFLFKEALAYKRRVRRLHNPDMSRVKWVQQQLRTAML